MIHRFQLWRRKAIERIARGVGGQARRWWCCRSAGSRQQQGDQVGRALEQTVKPVVGLHGSGANEWRDAGETGNATPQEQPSMVRQYHAERRSHPYCPARHPRLHCPFAVAALVQAPERPALMPSEGVLALHELQRSYGSFAEFQPELAALLLQGTLLDDCVTVTRALGILEPLTGEHIPPEALLIQGPNWRESLVGNGLLSRNRAALLVLEQLYGSLEALRRQDVYLVEALTGFALWLRRQLGEERLTCSEYLEEAEGSFGDIPHQDLCALTFASGTFDLVLCNELFEHVQYLDRAFAEVCRVLRPGGRLVGTCPLAFGQRESIVKAVADPQTGETQLLGEMEFHGDPIRPEHGAMVYRIPGWEMVEQLQEAGFSSARMHHVASWKHGVLGSDLPGVLVIEAQR